MKKVKAFSLLELLIVIGIILILVGAFLIPRFSGIQYRAKYAAAVNNISTLKLVLENYRLDAGKYPAQTSGLKALVEDAENVGINWNGPYLDKLPKDPWKNDYVYSLDQEKGIIKISSLGSDGKPGGTGNNKDIVE